MQKNAEIEKNRFLKDRNPSSKIKGKKKQDTQYIWWFLTWCNYPEDWDSYFINSKYLKKYILGIEVCPTTGTPHIQGNVECWTKQRLTAMKKIHKGIHWEPTKSNEFNVVKYCTKDMCFISKGLLIPYRVKLPSIYPWQQTLIDILDTEPNQRDIYWICGSRGGEGKTMFQKYICSINQEAIVLGGKGHDMKNGVLNYVNSKKKFPKIIFINLCRNDNLDYTGLEAMKDMFFYSGKYEGGMVVGPPPHIMVFSNEFPEELLSKDRLHVYNIDKNHHMKKCCVNAWHWNQDDDLQPPAFHASGNTPWVWKI